jgi:hypothetical protein
MTVYRPGCTNLDGNTVIIVAGVAGIAAQGEVHADFAERTVCPDNEVEVAFGVLAHVLRVGPIHEPHRGAGNGRVAVRNVVS